MREDKAKIVQRYARVLVKSATEYVKMDTQAIRKVIDESPEFRSILANPLISTAQKNEIIQRVFSGKLHPVTLNFLSALVERRRESLLPEMLDAFQTELDRAEDVLVVQVITAVEMNKELKDKLFKKITSITGKKVRIEAKIDKSIIGGMIVKIGDKTIDGSLTTVFQKLREHMIRGIR